MTTLANFKKSVIRLMGDEVALDDNSQPISPLQGGNLSAELLLDACAAAERAITIRQWKNAVLDISQAGDSFDLPPDLIEVDAVLDHDLRMFIPRMVFTHGVDQASLSTVGNAWLDSPNRKLTFTNGLKDTGAKIYYSADWTHPVSDTDVLESPEFCLTAMILYATSYCFLNQAAQQAILGAFKTKVDSGNPEDLPARVMSDFLIKRFENEMTRIPMKQKGTQ